MPGRLRPLSVHMHVHRATRATAIPVLAALLTTLLVVGPAPRPAAAAPVDLTPRTRPHGPPGAGQDVAHGRAAQERAQRDIALAATWHLDPSLLTPQPADSDVTAEARSRLAAINARVGDVVAAYDDARTAAEAAGVDARNARVALAQAQAELRAAAAAYRADRSLLVSVIDQSYSTTQMGALSLVLSADGDDDLLQGVTVLEEMGRVQASAVQASELSRERLQRATEAVAAADRRARETLAASREALARATAARDQVLTDVRTARRLLETSVLSDRALRDEAANGYVGALRFPLPAGTAFVDQHNWGHRSHHWASVHTGDDFSTACGTPVLAVNDGTVVIRTDQAWSGPWLLMVSTGDGGLTTWYAHMQSLGVTNGQQVHAGQQIGVVGQQGNATGCHLHLEVHPEGGTIYADDIDPSAWLHTVGVYPGA